MKGDWSWSAPRASRRTNARPSVASFFVSRVDAKADTRLSAHSRLRGRVAVLNARAAHRRYLAVLSGSRWKALAAKGANPQRPLWASMAPKSDEYTDVFYLDALAFPGSVATVPRETLHAYAHHGNPERAGPPPSDDRDHPDLASAVDLAAIARELEREGLEAFAAAYEEILGALRTEDEGHAALRY